MEKKKELIIKVLTKMKPYRNLAEGILALVESNYMDEKTIDGIIHIMNQSIKSIKKENEKELMQKWIEKIQKIKLMEEGEKISEEELDKILFDI